MNAMELSARLSLDASNFHKGMQNAENGFKGFGNRLKALGSRLAVGVGAAATAVGAAFYKVGKDAVKAYGRFEQLEGGIKTLFGEQTAKTMFRYADQAYKEAGVSANKYMELSTSFANSLIQGLGGDTDKAAKMANMAIIDMSDNANKMGTDLTAIQNAYQGFAKQNYTMLDNLKLGYGGTKTEMERLLATAGKLTGKKFDVSNFAHIVEAIHAIQSNLKIAGTTKDEAEGTLEGSMNMFKAAWEDMLVAVTSPETQQGFKFIQDEFNSTSKTVDGSQTKIRAASTKLVESAKTMLKNMLPAVKNFISGFGDVITAIAPMIGEELPQLLADFLPKFFEAGKNLVVGIGRGITKAFQTFKWPTWKEVQAGAQKAWQGIQKGVETLGGLVFGKNVDGSVKWPTWADVGAAIQAGWNTIVAGVEGLAKVVFGENVDGSIKWPTWDEIGAAVQAGWNGIVAGVEGLAKVIFGTNVDGSIKWPTWDEIGASIQAGWDGIVSGVEGLAKVVFGTNVDGSIAWPTWEDLGASIQAGWDGIVAGVEGLAKVVFGANVDGSIAWPTWDSIGASVEAGWKTIVDGVAGLAKVVFGSKVDGSIDWPTWSKISTAVTGAWEEICAQAGALTGFVFGDAANASSIFDDILTSWNKLHDTITQGAINISTYFFDTADPTVVSTAIKGIADAIIPLAAGLATAGFIANFGKFIEGIKKLFDIGLKDTNWVAIAIGAIATLATYIMQNWDDFGPKFEAIGGWITDNIITPVSTAISKIQDIINKVKEFLGLGGNEPSGAVLSEEQIGGIQKAFENWQEVSKWDFEEGFKAFDKFKETLKGAMTEAGFSKKEIENTFKGIDDALNNGDVAGIQNIISNLNSTSGAAQAAEDAVNAIKEAAEAAAGDYNINFNVTTTGTIPNTLYAPASGGIAPTRPRGIKKAKGDWNIPYDNYPAILHRDEMVLTASQARQYREGQNSGIDAATLASAMRSAVLDLTMEFNGREVGRMFGDSTTARVNRNIGQINRRRRYGYGG